MTLGKNDSLVKIWKSLMESNKIVIFPHIHADGDTLGSSMALYYALKNAGKKVYILMEDKVPDNLEFLLGGNITYDSSLIKGKFTSLCIDLGDFDRLPKRKEFFLKGETQICIDHHRTTSHFLDLNYIDYTASATTEIVYALLKKNKVSLDYNIATAIYTGIITDTGNFQYSNTTKKTHEIVSKLYDYRDSFNEISLNIYESVPFKRLKLQGQILNSLETFKNGKAVMAVVTKKVLKSTGCKMEDGEGLVSLLRSIKDVEVSIILKETKKNETKISMRSKEYLDVSKIAETFNGGGHIRAAGCTINANYEEALKLIKKEVEKWME